MKETRYLRERIFLAYTEQLSHFTIVPANWSFRREEILGKTVTYSKAPPKLPLVPKACTLSTCIHTK